MEWTVLTQKLGRPITIRTNADRAVIGVEFQARTESVKTLTETGGKLLSDPLAANVIPALEASEVFLRYMSLRRDETAVDRKVKAAQASRKEIEAKIERLVVERSGGWYADVAECKRRLPVLDQQIAEGHEHAAVIAEQLGQARLDAEKELREMAEQVGDQLRKATEDRRNGLLTQLGVAVSPVLDELLTVQKALEMAMASGVASQRLVGLVRRLGDKKLAAEGGVTVIGLDDGDDAETPAPDGATVGINGVLPTTTGAVSPTIDRMGRLLATTESDTGDEAT
jgi:hypothetical protein